ncbi:membrane protein FAM174A [Varanus komodoensis]|uniref:Transmembrane protein 157 n=1 Tax=Varanus komodoensis TaxID=61221 RepID=A0A8D2LHV9_VARKO|nr:membrane protein FAM174A [Varanus komodoensis]
MRRLSPPPSPLPLLLLPALLLVAALCGEGAPALTHPPQPVHSGANAVPAATPAGTDSPDGGEAVRSANESDSSVAPVHGLKEAYQPMTQRALSVLVLASAALIVYFVIRTVRLRRRNRKTRRYGVLDTNIENTELTPLEQDDDDDDTTLFDANHPRR